MSNSHDQFCKQMTVKNVFVCSWFKIFEAGFTWLKYQFAFLIFTLHANSPACDLKTDEFCQVL